MSDSNTILALYHYRLRWLPVAMSGTFDVRVGDFNTGGIPTGIFDVTAR